MLTEKYRPQTLSQFIGHDKLKLYLLTKKSNNSRPDNLLFYGPPGTGKTTLANIIATMFTSDANIRYINASDHNKIDFFRNEVYPFLISKSIDKKPFKVIILDEANRITSDSFGWLKVNMEEYSNIIFIFITNDIQAIDPSIRSRCSLHLFDYPSLIEKELLYERIVQNEGISLSDDIKNVILKYSKDFRDVIHLIEWAHSTKADKEELLKNIFQYSDFIQSLLNNSNFMKRLSIIQRNLKQGYAPEKMITEMLNYIVKVTDYKEEVIEEAQIVASRYNKSLPQISLMATLKLFQKYT